MSKSASRALFALGALVVALPIVAFEVGAAVPSQAAEAGAANGQAAEGAPAAEPVRPPGFACGDKELTGSGPGFDSSREHSQETAKADWLVKARAIYADASWETAKKLSLTCAQQGLYSKCFASAVPCGVQKSSAAAEPPAKSN